MTGADDGPARSLAVEGFRDGARYDSVRPDYPVAALDYLTRAAGLTRSSRVLDLGAGTGILTRQLLGYVDDVVAVEPTAGMRDVLRRALPEVTALDGRDVAIPLADASLDAVFVAQAFHWFDAPRALDEIRRVLRPGATLALLWNERDETVPWVGDLSRAMRWDVCMPYEVGRDFAPVVAAGPFVDVERRSFDHHQVLTREALYRLVLTRSYVAVMTDDERAPLMAQVERVVEALDEPVTLPYVTEVYRATASP
ncbi:MAG: class I SAM-dependent methyltransferase [Acidimicrobiales bacterium]